MSNQEPLTDQCPMPWGIHKGEDMEDVPAKYLLWCYNNDKCCPRVKEYIEDNMDCLEKEINNQQS